MTKVCFKMNAMLEKYLKEKGPIKYIQQLSFKHLVK